MTFKDLASLLIAVGDPPLDTPLTIVSIPRNRTRKISDLVSGKGAFITGYENDYSFPVSNPENPGREFIPGHEFSPCAAIFRGHREFPGLETIKLEPPSQRNISSPVPRGWTPIGSWPEPGDTLLIRDPWSPGGWKRFTVPPKMPRLAPVKYPSLLKRTP
jgi:hypothetical protein